MRKLVIGGLFVCVFNVRLATAKVIVPDGTYSLTWIPNHPDTRHMGLHPETNPRNMGFTVLEEKVMDSPPKETLPLELVVKARVELNEIQSEVPGQIKALRETILANPKFNFRTDDGFLLRFLRARKFNQKRALELMINYYKQREHYPQLYRKWPSAGLEASFSSSYQGVLFHRDADGCAILIFSSMFHWDPSVVPIDDLFTHCLLSLERLIEEDEVQINGVVAIVNYKGLSMKHLWQFSPLAAKRSVSVLVNSFPVRFKAIHYINEPFLFDALFAILKPFLSKKLLSRIHFHGSCLDNLHRSISPEILPVEFGGHLGRYDNTEWNKVLKSHEDTARNNLSFGFAKKT